MSKEEGEKVNNEREEKRQQERKVNLSKFVEPYSYNVCYIQRVRYSLIHLSVTGIKKIVSFPCFIYLFIAIAQAVLTNELRSQSPLNLCEIRGY